MFRCIALIFGMILAALSTTHTSHATLSTISGELQIGATVSPDQIKIRALEKKIQAQKTLITETKTAIKYAEGKILVAKKLGKSTKIFELKLKELQTKKLKQEAALKVLIKKLALLIA